MPDDAFATMRWVRDLPIIRDGKGRADLSARVMLFTLATYADGDTGENAWPSNRTLAQAIGSDDPRDARRVLERLEKLRLIEETGTKWHRGGEISVWRLRIEDDDAELALAEVNEDQERARKATRAARDRRYYERRTGRSSTELNPSKPVRRNATRRTTELSASYDGSEPVVRRNTTHRSTGSSAPDQPIDQPRLTSPVDQPGEPHTRSAAPSRERAVVGNLATVSRFPRGVAGARQAEALAEQDEPTPDLAEQLIEYVVPRLPLADADIRRSHTILMAFSDRHPDALAIAEMGFEMARQMGGEIELGHFERENDGIFAVPLAKRLDTRRTA